jgi:hypothetical protein
MNSSIKSLPTMSNKVYYNNNNINNNNNDNNNDNDKYSKSPILKRRGIKITRLNIIPTQNIDKSIFSPKFTDCFKYDEELTSQNIDNLFNTNKNI